MGPITQTLCQKAAIGAGLWITGLCAFPPPVPDRPLVLEEAGASVSADFKAPVDGKYWVVLGFAFASVQARLDDSFVGNSADTRCQTDPGSLPEGKAFGSPVPVRVEVWAKGRSEPVSDLTHVTRCVMGHAQERKTRAVGALALKRGDYRIRITNIAAQPAVAGVKTTVALVPGGGK